MRAISYAIAAILLSLDGCQQPSRWVEVWAPAQQLVEPKNQPPAPLSHAVLRQIIHPTLAGQAAIFHFSNCFGDAPLTIESCHVAVSKGSGKIDPATDHLILFSGESSATLPPGSELLSDPITIAVQPALDLAITLKFGNVPSALTGHPGSRTTSFLFPAGNPTAAELSTVQTTAHWYVISGLDVIPDRCIGGLIILGDSIADGRGSDTDQNNRWPDDLARRLCGIAVVNSGIGGNRLNADGLGPSALARFDRDIATAAGAKWLIVSEGVNDIGTSHSADAEAIAKEVVHAYQQIIIRCHRLGLKVIGTTILPFAGSIYDTPTHETARQLVNFWIRTANHFDAVIDFDRTLCDPKVPTRLQLQYETGDHIHPNANGYHKLADSIDREIFSK